MSEPGLRAGDGHDVPGSTTRPFEASAVPIVEVVITAQDAAWLASFARSLVDDRLAACAQVVVEVRSTYRWQGEVRDDREARVALHTRAALVDVIVDRTVRAHADDVPCVIALPVVAGNPDYVAWVLDMTGEK